MIIQGGWLKVCYYLLLKRDVAFHLNKIESELSPLCLVKELKFRQLFAISLSPPLEKGQCFLALCHIWLKLAHWFWIRRFLIVVKPRRGTVEYSVGLASGRLGVRIPTATDLSRKKGSDSSTAKRSAIGVSVTSPRR